MSFWVCKFPNISYKTSRIEGLPENVTTSLHKNCQEGTWIFLFFCGTENYVLDSGDSCNHFKKQLACVISNLVLEVLEIFFTSIEQALSSASGTVLKTWRIISLENLLQTFAIFLWFQCMAWTFALQIQSGYELQSQLSGVHGIERIWYLLLHFQESCASDKLSTMFGSCSWINFFCSFKALSAFKLTLILQYSNTCWPSRVQKKDSDWLLTSISWYGRQDNSTLYSRIKKFLLVGADELCYELEKELAGSQCLIEGGRLVQSWNTILKGFIASIH